METNKSPRRLGRPPANPAAEEAVSTDVEARRAMDAMLVHFGASHRVARVDHRESRWYSLAEIGGLTWQVTIRRNPSGKWEAAMMDYRHNSGWGLSSTAEEAANRACRDYDARIIETERRRNAERLEAYGVL
jgi:hypothetical protein